MTSQAIINHNEPIVRDVEVMQVLSSQQAPTGGHVWTFLYPGCHVYLWDGAGKQVLNRLDCSKLVPCSESLKTIAIDEHFMPGSGKSGQVSALALQADKLYIGTSWGCLIVTEAATLRPITVFRPYSQELQAIVTVSQADSDVNSSPLVVTLGKGYRNLIGRYVTDGDTNKKDDSDSGTVYALLWRPDDWMSD